MHMPARLQAQATHIAMTTATAISPNPDAGAVALTPTEVAHLAVDTAADKLAADIVMLDLRGLTAFADYFVVMTAE